MKKTPTTGGKTSVTFELPAAVTAERAVICGEFNDWSKTSHPLKRRKDGSLAVTLRLAPGRYRYRFLLDGAVWENDWDADAYAPNGWGSDNSIVIVE